MSEVFDRLWERLAPLGRHRTTGGYRRFSWGPADAEVRAWFTESARALGLDVETDRNGNLWAWWGAPGPDAVVTGSHLDSVPDGGAYDGPLGVVSALAAVAELRGRGLRPRRPLAVTVFVEEEGARFGVPCLGTRLLTGAITPDRAARLTDAEGTTWAAAMAGAGLDPERIGADPDLLGRVGVFVELHVEQGRALARTDAPVGVASAVWPHGRWRLDFAGQADHAGTTRLADRNDPMLPFAETVLAARAAAHANDALATIGKVHVAPNGTNAIPSRVRAWLDARAPSEAALRAVVQRVDSAARRSAADHGVTLATYLESASPVVHFDRALRDRIAALVGGAAGPAPVLPTGAGHDAAVLSSAVPTAMLFVRNPTGLSHAPEEFVEPADRHAGVAALTEVLAELAGAGPEGQA
ncbi:allantoate amidohydrolase [Streptomonospora nanhaiensis]|uniref:N-carbamoyl-L-amino-acid hydrolase n=1 Tax=Streptomonospora nanhaiensis TaxID=1323731 RepID=A0A853BVA3_9ACTN|nr:allantoate amidohydrolase [Streptomonospora nanhaiensis]MBV2365662.1 allantoate amidohydrolase [Streptomonospora nanhaiensis]MBX9388116.1 allantoate amidohydrolase [Streptomonospora nanhaiensis]NYI98900.1 N-carbamoyl-L-amino-acid hydrolase [Streptomonospora nanhaiensis]